MIRSQKQIVLAVIGALLLLSLLGGSWTSTLGAPLGQTTLLTHTPDPDPDDDPDPTVTATAVVRPPARPVPLIFIVSVEQDKTVTIRTANFPKNTDFDVLMNFYGTLGIGGTRVATVNSAGGGALTWTFNIPDFLKGSTRIAIRLQSKNGYYAFNWFWNFNNSGAGAPPPGPGIPAGKIPTFKIVSVVPDTSVTIETANFPANDKFDVFMNLYGTLGIGGIKVDTIDSAAGGKRTFTFNIPAGLKGNEKIAIRLQSPKSGYYAYNWFWNKSSGGSATPPPGSGVPAGLIPSIKIQSVLKDGKITLLTSNFPANDSFKVTMNEYGSRGIGGTLVDTIDSASGGSLTLTFDIPEAMKGKQRIAIRLESTASGYFAYNWFWNSTYP